MEKTDCSELLDLVAEREGILLAEGEATGSALVSAWVSQLTPRQIDMISAYDAQVDRYRAKALSYAGNLAVSAPERLQ
jgi:hypothetical protein